MKDLVFTLWTWLTIWLNSNLGQLARRHEFLQESNSEGLLYELVMLAYEIRIRQLIEKAVKKVHK